MRTISDTFTGLGIARDEKVIMEMHDKGIVLSNGDEVSYQDLARILSELQDCDFLSKAAKCIDITSHLHLNGTLAEMSRLFNVIHYAAK